MCVNLIYKMCLTRQYIPILVLFCSLIVFNVAQNKWPKSTPGIYVPIPYAIQGGVYTQTQLDVIQQAMYDIQNVTCVRFIKRKQQKDYIMIYSKKGIGCEAPLGKKGGMQLVSLNYRGCIQRKIVVHELIHTIGFRHMFVRYDRDKYLTIYLANVKNEARHLFNKVQNQYEAYGTPFDLLSAMMYRKDAESKNGNNTIVPKDPNYLDKIGAVTTLSEGDALRINRMYKCRV